MCPGDCCPWSPSFRLRRGVSRRNDIVCDGSRRALDKMTGLIRDLPVQNPRIFRRSCIRDDHRPARFKPQEATEVPEAIAADIGGGAQVDGLSHVGHAPASRTCSGGAPEGGE